MPVRFLVIATGYNCSAYAGKFLNSLKKQTHKEFTAVIVDDGSADGTKQCLEEEPADDRILIHSFPENLGAAKCRWKAIHFLAEDQDEETVVVIAGLDDELMPDALETVAKHYEAGKWMTYGNWIRSDGYKLKDSFLEFSSEVHRLRSYRQDVFRSTALNTFKRFLYNKLQEQEFKHKGLWMRATTESHLMFSCIEMCGESRIGIVKEHIYLYNLRPDNAVTRAGREYQNAVYADVISRNKKDLLP